MNHSQKQELRDLTNSFMNNDTDVSVFTRPLTTIEFAFCIMVLDKQEPDLIGDFCEEYCDTFNWLIMIIFFSIFYFIFSGIVTFESYKQSKTYSEKKKKTTFMYCFLVGCIALPMLIGRNLK